MPELPEVETVRRTLSSLIIGKKITSIIVSYKKIIVNTDDKTFITSLTNQTFRNISRRGKYLIIYLDDFVLISHLRMEGKYFYINNTNPEERTKHDHIIFIFDDAELRYNDTRKFGRMYLYKLSDVQNNLNNIEPLSSLGYEPFDKECTADYLYQIFKHKNIPIKGVLLDQHIMAGLGNIYVDEVLFLSKIHPELKASKLSLKQIQNIIDNSIIVLNKAIDLGGTTIRSFQSSYHVTGRFQNELLVHEQKECPICHEQLIKKYVVGRGTYYCEKCQKKDS